MGSFESRIARMSHPQHIRLFIKPGCPWCDEAMQWLDARGVRYTALDVLTDSAAWQEMKDLTGQTKAPSIEVDGRVLADFGADELAEWWSRMKFAP